MSTDLADPSRDAAIALYDDPDYHEAKGIGHRATGGCTMVRLAEGRMAPQSGAH